jgi:hypothetical protein
MIVDIFKNIEIIQGQTKTFRFKFTNKKTHTPVNIGGNILFFTAKCNVTDPDSSAVISKTIDIPYNSDSANGICYCPLTYSDTNIDFGEYLYDFTIQENESGGEILDRTPIATGTLIVNASETQRTS